MRKIFIFIFGIACLVALSCEKSPVAPATADNETFRLIDSEWDNVKRGNITYQLLIYSFADSDGDGVGDFNGITSKLDYLDGLGVSALWLSPIHPSSSYHGYDVEDYYSVNAEFGSEADLRNLIAKAHEKGIRIYLDYVLNHSASRHPWFIEASKNKSSKYRDYYVFSPDPRADIAAGKIPSIATEGAGGYDARQWYAAKGELGAKGIFHFEVDMTNASVPVVTVTETTSAAQQSNADASINVYIYWGQDRIARMYRKQAEVYEITLDFDSSWGFLVRTSNTGWTGGTKFGASASDPVVEFGVPKTLNNSEAADITFSAPEYYHSHFWTDWFADFNYGAAASAASSPAFADLANSAKKWIDMGVDGLRLDAVKHIYHNANSDENPTFLKAWYDKCNEFYHATGRTDDIYMVGEQYSSAAEVAPYYKGLPAYFEFDYWERLKWVLNNGVGCYFAKDIVGYRESYLKYRSNPIAAVKLSNHDQTRTAQSLGKDSRKLMQAAAFLLTSGGEPYIYQGEELGYWGSASDGGGSDELVRTPIMWYKTGVNLAAGALGGKVDMSMLTPEISVEAQSAGKSSLLNVYRGFARLRNSRPELASGTMSEHGKYNSSAAEKSAALWYMTDTQGNRMLVVHNVGASEIVLELADDLSRPVVNLGEVKIDGKSLTLGARSSVVFDL